MRVLKLNFVEAPPSSTQFIRTFDFDKKNSRIDDLARLTEDGTNILPERLAKVASSLLSPNTTSRDKFVSQIDGGWDQKRIMFSMVVETSSRPNHQEYEYIVGHTDYDGFSLIGMKEVKLDPRMKLYFDQITHINLSGGIRRNSEVWTPSIKSSDLILNRDTLRGFGHDDLASRGTDRALSKRPTDLLRREGASLSYNQDNFSFDENSDRRQPESNTNNTVGTFTQQLKLSSRDNNSATSFLHRTLDGYVSASTGAGLDTTASPYGLGDERSNKLSNLKLAYGRVDENDPSADRYIEELKESTRILNSGYITYGELMEMNPEFVKNEQETFARADTRRSYRHSDTKQWQGDDHETIAALTIANSLPGLMIKNMYSKLDKLTINSYGHSKLSRITGCVASPYIDGLDTEATWPNFEHHLSEVLIHEVSRGIFNFEAKIDANVDGYVDIWIRIDGGPESFHSFPAYCAALMSPTLDTNVSSLNSMSTTLTDISNDLATRRMGHSRIAIDNPLRNSSGGLQLGIGGIDRRDAPSSRTLDTALSSSSLDIPAKKNW